MAALLPQGAEALLARRSLRFQELGLQGRTFGEDELLDLLAREPRLLRRPILYEPEAGRAVVGSAQKILAEAFGLGAEAAGASPVKPKAGAGRAKGNNAKTTAPGKDKPAAGGTGAKATGKTAGAPSRTRAAVKAGGAKGNTAGVGTETAKGRGGS